MHTLKDTLKAYPFYLLPHHLISRIIYRLTRIESPWVQPAIKKFSKAFNINLSEAKIQNLNEFKTFNEFFTRELKPDARPIAQGENILSCPVDGTISQAQSITQGQMIQAKQHSYSVQALLGGDNTLSTPFQNGIFSTIYLSPRDYHRIHMPCDATLTHQIYIPGRLFSVAPFTVNTIPGLFARNERVAALFDTKYGRMAMVLVGAINVAAIETVWDGLITPPAGKSIQTKTYPQGQVSLKKGDEMGRFNMGSTIVWLMESQDFKWCHSTIPGTPTRMGKAYMEYQPKKNKKA